MIQSLPKDQKQHLVQFIGTCVLSTLIGHAIATWYLDIAPLYKTEEVTWFWLISFSYGITILAASLTLFGSAGIRWHLIRRSANCMKPTLFQKYKNFVLVGFIVNIFAILLTLYTSLRPIECSALGLLPPNMWWCAFTNVCTALCGYSTLQNYTDAEDNNNIGT